MVPSFTVLGAEFNLEYESLHLIYFVCGKYYHKMDACPDSIKTSVSNDHIAIDKPSGSSNKGEESAINASHDSSAINPENQQLEKLYKESIPMMEESCSGPGCWLGKPR